MFTDISNFKIYVSLVLNSLHTFRLLHLPLSKEIFFILKNCSSYIICATGIEDYKENISATKNKKVPQLLCVLLAQWWQRHGTKQNHDARGETFHPKCWRPHKVNTLFSVRKVRNGKVKKLRPSDSLGTRFGRDSGVLTGSPGSIQRIHSGTAIHTEQ